MRFTRVKEYKNFHRAIPTAFLGRKAQSGRQTMMVPFLRAALMIGGFTGLMACSQQAPQSGGADFPHEMSQRARLCIAEGRPDSSASERTPWSLTVSSEGGACQHIREWGRVEQVAYEIVQPPLHGRITQEAQGGKIVVSYWPEHGYVGADNFILRYPPRNLALTYLVGVMP
jgi:hypothetical protein